MSGRQDSQGKSVYGVHKPEKHQSKNTKPKYKHEEYKCTTSNPTDMPYNKKYCVFVKTDGEFDRKVVEEKDIKTWYSSVHRESQVQNLVGTRYMSSIGIWNIPSKYPVLIGMILVCPMYVTST